MSISSYLEYKESFYKINPELYELIEHHASKPGVDYFTVMEKMGGKKVREDIKNIYYKARNTNDYDSYADDVLDYFRNNPEMHEEWIINLKFYTL